MFTLAKTTVSGVVAAGMLAASVLVIAPAAQAQAYYGRHYHRYYNGYDNGGGALAAGFLGLAAGMLLSGAINDRGGSYCADHFRTYNPATGTYMGYDGLRHSCP